MNRKPTGAVLPATVRRVRGSSRGRQVCGEQPKGALVGGGLDAVERRKGTGATCDELRGGLLGVVLQLQPGRLREVRGG